MRRCNPKAILWMPIALATALLQSNSGWAGVDFDRDIRPILAENCLACHGPDEGKRKGGLRLDTLDGAMADLGGYRAVVPKDLSASKLLEVITSEDAEVRMPPPKTGKNLDTEQQEVLGKWIEEGAHYARHWAYEPLGNTQPPNVQDEDWIRSPIDHYVLARLEASGVRSSVPADRYTLVKRLHYDLLGLPAPVETVDAFVNSNAPDAYTALVDQLLESPHFGERWGRHWLDKARYADSDGYEKDRPRPNAWRYRDWVIDAINRDLPFNKFTIEQVAGDLLPDATPLQHLATAFHRQTLTNTEGGTDREQWRVAAVMDRVETTGAVWLGLTVGCARCHTHKYDSISQDEYYQLFAFYNNGDESNFNVPIPDQQSSYHKRKAVHEAKVAEFEHQLKAQQERAGNTFEQWIERSSVRAKDAKPAQFHTLTGAKASASTDGFAFDGLDDGSIFVAKSGAESATFLLEATLQNDQPITGFRVDALSDPRLPKNGPGLTAHGNFVLSEFRAFTTDLVDPALAIALPPGKARADFSQNKWPAQHAIDGQSETGWAISPQMGRDHYILFTLLKPLDARQSVQLRIELEQAYGTLHMMGRFRIRAMTGEDSLNRLPDNVRNALLADADKRTAAQGKLLREHFISQDTDLSKLKKQLDDLRKKAPKPPMLSVRVINQRNSSPRKTHVLHRGEFKHPQHEVPPGTLGTLHSLQSRDKQKTPDRLDFARWLVDPANPLTPRVVLNQIWANLFGHGLVRTLDDFGVRGDPPSHPQLLDHLAQELIRNQWSRKALIRYIVNSATYRQASRHRPELADRDPQNHLLHRQNRFRVEGEIVRDLSLDAAGLLSRKMGGPCVYPPLPGGVANLSYANNFKWNTSKGEDRHRRGLYTFFKRTSPHPNLLTFDCPDSNTTCIQRRISNTPLAALVTLNNQVFTEAAQGFGKRILSEKGSDRERLTQAFRTCVARPPVTEEINSLESLLIDARSWYTDNPGEATKLAGAHPAQGIDATENAAWVATARVLLNLDEFLTRE